MKEDYKIKAEERAFECYPVKADNEYDHDENESAREIRIEGYLDAIEQEGVELLKKANKDFACEHDELEKQIAKLREALEEIRSTKDAFYIHGIVMQVLNQTQ